MGGLMVVETVCITGTNGMCGKLGATMKSRVRGGCREGCVDIWKRGG